MKRALTLGSLVLLAACSSVPPAKPTIVAAPPQATPPTANYRPLLTGCGQPAGPAVTDTPESQTKVRQSRLLPCLIEGAAMLLTGRSPRVTIAVPVTGGGDAAAPQAAAPGASTASPVRH